MLFDNILKSKSQKILMKEKKLVEKIPNPAQLKFKRHFSSKLRGFKKNLIKREISVLEDKK